MEPTRMQIAYQQLRRKMLSGELPPGTRLVNRALGAEFGLSTVTVREAIHRLTSEGLIEHVPNAGAYVRALDRSEVGALYRFRDALEEFALQEIVRRGGPDELAHLDELCDRMRAILAAARRAPGRRIEGAQHRAWLEVDLTFHAELAAAAANPWLTKTLNELDLLGRIAATKSTSIDMLPAARTYRFHREIVRALRARDLERALAWMRRHSISSLATALARPDPA